MGPRIGEEIESNLLIHIADNLRTGVTAGEARRQALIRLGGVEATKEAYRDQRRLPAFDTLLQDIRYVSALVRFFTSLTSR